MWHHRLFLSVFFAAHGLCCLVWADDLNFGRNIRPILSDKCYACHGPNESSRQADLRLDIRAIAIESGAIFPNKKNNSKLWQRINSTDPEVVMPPPKTNRKLAKQERELLGRWIAQGAKYSKHWSFVPPKKVRLPDLPKDRRGGNEIDRFVWRNLAVNGLMPSTEADRYSLIRRVSLDLTGLPPSARQVMAFVGDNNPRAYEKVVDRLLENPHYGERMTLEWLDAARYADTNGFSIDGGRHMWLWRDWVLQAFNSNKPYHEFLIEQIAGDLLPDPSSSNLIATGFQRNNMVTHEGGTIPEENLTNYNADRVKTLGEAVLGLTFGCAQCHDHKYDPISQRDYYRLFAYFNTLDDIGLDGNSGVNPKPYVKSKTVLKTGEIPALQGRIAQLKSQLRSIGDSELSKWEHRQQTELGNRGKGLTLLLMPALKVSTPNRGSGFEIREDRFVQIMQPGGLAAYDVLARIPETVKPITGVRVVFHPEKSAPGGGWGFGLSKPPHDGVPKALRKKGSFRLTAISISAGEVPADQVDLFRLLPPDKITASSWESEHRPENSADPRRHNGWSPLREQTGPVHLTFTFKHPLQAGALKYMTTQLNFGAGGNQIAARMEIFAMLGVDDGTGLSPEVVSVLEIKPAQRTEKQRRVVRDYFTRHASATNRLRVDLANAEERLEYLTAEFPTMVMNVASKPRATFILKQGDYLQPTDKVMMGTPDSLPVSTEPQVSRLSLARWITMPDHPLTSRVYVNRVWQMMFGAGLVRTPANFGSQGEWPTHPELLDYLAVDFVESGWNVKALVKKIAMSATYRQSSVASPEQQKRDPVNRLLDRGPRFRLPAELIRDGALQVSGLMRPYMGGPSVNPYTPIDLWREISHYGSTPATAQTFVQDHGDKLYRRSLYTFWKRTAPPPNMVAFDAPNRETCVVSRPITNTPLQALVMLNDVQFVEAARAFAERILGREQTDYQRMQWAVMEALSRPATKQEMQVLINALQRERSYYRIHEAAASELLSVGESVRNPGLSIVEHGAWTQISSTIFNLSEFVTRN